MRTTIPSKPVTCLGPIYKYKENVFINSKDEIICRTSLYPVKKLSCLGCSQCGWIDEYIQESMYNGTLGELFQGAFTPGDMFYIAGIGGRGFFSEDDFEIVLRRYDER
jgi:hypothetical protein